MNDNFFENMNVNIITNVLKTGPDQTRPVDSTDLTAGQSPFWSDLINWIRLGLNRGWIAWTDSPIGSLQTGLFNWFYLIFFKKTASKRRRFDVRSIKTMPFWSPKPATSKVQTLPPPPVAAAADALRPTTPSQLPLAAVTRWQPSLS